MKKLILASGLGILLFCLGCGGGSSSNNGGFTPSGNFSNASLSGQYTYRLSGTDTNGPFEEAGVFTADGNQNITSGIDDFAQGGGFATNAISGNYSLLPDGTGSATLNFPNGGFITLGLTLSNTSSVALIEQDTFGNGAGTAQLQNTGAFATTPAGTFAFRIHSSSGLQGSGCVGVFTVAGGVITGNEDVNRGGLSSSLTLTGTLTAPDGTGRGTATLADSSGVTSDFIYYVVDGNNLRLISTDAGVLGAGKAEKQAATTFSAASLTGSYAFGSQGDTAATTGGTRTIGRFSSDGVAAISAGGFDSVQDGVSTADATFTGSYMLDATGRGTFTFTPSSGGTVQEVFYLVNAARGFFLIDDANRIEDGSFDQQSATTFSNSSLSGQYAFLMDGFDSTDLVDRVGTFIPDGKGTLTLNVLVNRTGVVLNPLLTGTYSFSSSTNGRAVANIPSLSSNLVLYMISGSNAYILQNDSGVEISGSIAKQQ